MNLQKRNIKNNYSKKIFKYSNKIIKLIPEHEIDWILSKMEEFIDSLSIKNFLKMYSDNKDLATNLLNLGFDFKKENIKYYLETYGEELLSINSDVILRLDRKFVDKFINYIKRDLDKTNLFLSYCNTERGIFNINHLMELGLTEEDIFNNISVVSVLFQYGGNYINDLDYVKILIKMSPEEVGFFFEICRVIDDTKIYEESYDGYKKINNFFKKNLLLNYNSDSIEKFKKLFFDYDNRSFNSFLSKFQQKELKEFRNMLMNSFLLDNSIDFLFKKKYIGYVIFSINSLKFNFEDMLANCGDVEYSEEIQKYLQLYKEYKDCSNEQKLINWYNLYLDSQLVSVEEFKKIMIKDYNKNLGIELLKSVEKIKESNDVKKISEEYVSKFDGKVHNLERYVIRDIPFLMLTTSLVEKGFSSGAISDEQALFTSCLYKNPKLWLSNPECGTNYISMSLNNEERFANFSMPKVLLGFFKIGETQILASYTNDAGTNMKPKTTISNQTQLVSIKKLVSNSVPDKFVAEPSIYHNEVVSSRQGILPDYVLVASVKNNANIPVISDDVREWASYYHIPIFEIDCECYFNIKYEFFLNCLEQVKKQKTVPTFEELYRLEYLRKKAYNFAPFGYELLDPFSMIMQSIDMKNREWNEENIYNLNSVINFLCDNNVLSASLLKNDLNNIEKCKEYLNSWDSIIKNKFQYLLNDVENTSYHQKK